MDFPFAELTNRTPSPSQKEDSSYARKHSPWTAARQKKKTRSVQEQQHAAHNAALPVPAQPESIPEAFDSPAQVRTAAGGSAEYSLGDCLSPVARGTTASPHSSPPVSKGSAEDAEVHPSKAYITSPQATQQPSPDCMELGSAGGVDLAAAAAARGGPAGDNCRSPVWFRSSAVADALQDAGARGQLHASSSAPACGNLFDRFDQVAQQQQQQQRPQQHQRPSQQQERPQARALQHHHSQPCMQLHTDVPAQQQQQPAAQAAGQQQGAGVLRGRRLTARRGGSWGGFEQQQLRSSTAGSVGPSRMGPAAGRGSSSSQCLAARADHAASGGRDWQQHVLSATSHSSSAALMACASGQQQHCADSGFQLHSRLSHIDFDDERAGGSSGSRVAERRRSFGSGLLSQQRQQQRRRWGQQERAGAGVDCWAQQETGMEALTGGAAGWCAAAGEADDSLAWYEAQMQEAADEGDLELAQQLWGSLQAEGLAPSHCFMNGLLICCHYAGADPVEAEEAVRDMCAAAGMAPDGLTTKLLTLIDISWQQLQYGGGGGGGGGGM